MAAKYGAAGWLIVGVDPSKLSPFSIAMTDLLPQQSVPVIAPESLSSAAYNSNS